MAHWLVKTEPNEFSFEDLVRDRRTVWDGVRNYQARNNLRQMQPGDWVLVYHSVGPKTLVGLAQVASDPYSDPTDNEKGMWTVVDMIPVKPLNQPVTLEVIKAEMPDLPLVKQSRLSVMPLIENQFSDLLALAKTKL